MECRSCGAPLRAAMRVCAYCGSLAEEAAAVGPAMDAGSAGEVEPRALEASLRRELAFLVEQQVETGHPSIARKIENVERRLGALLQQTGGV